MNICLVWCSIKIYRKYSEVRTTATLLERSTSRVSLRFLTVLLRLNNVRETRCQRPLSSGSFLVQARPCDQLNSTKFLLFSIPYLYWGTRTAYSQTIWWKNCALRGKSTKFGQKKAVRLSCHINAKVWCPKKVKLGLTNLIFKQRGGGSISVCTFV